MLFPNRGYRDSKFEKMHLSGGILGLFCYNFCIGDGMLLARGHISQDNEKVAMECG
jgi:hypothetical protein